MVAIGIPHDVNLYDKIFRLFDINDNGVVDQKEVMAALDLFKEHSFEEKVRSNFISEIFLFIIKIKSSLNWLMKTAEEVLMKKNW